MSVSTLAMLAGLTTTFAVWTLFVALLQCGDTCGQGVPPPGVEPWRRQSGAWQWWGQFGLAVAAAAATCVATLHGMRGRRRRTVVSLATAVVLIAAWSLAF
jgi:hypothetical protein